MKAKIYLILLALDVLVMVGGVTLVFLGTMAHDMPQITEDSLRRDLASLGPKEDELIPLVYTMDKLTVNLGGEPKRSIRIEVNLEMLNKEGFEEVMSTENRAKARDRILSLLNDMEFSQIENIQGKLLLKSQISKEINGILNRGIVKDIYFSDFVVQ